LGGGGMAKSVKCGVRSFIICHIVR